MAAHPVTLSNGTDRSLANLSNGHKRGIETTLGLLDEELCRFEEWAQGREIHSVLYHEQNTLSSEQRDVLSSEVAMMKEILLELQNSLKLEGRVRSSDKKIQAQCATLWVNLTELTSKYLRRYGELPVELTEYLDRRIFRLIDHLNKIVKIMGAK
jgi:hypothetical protein